MTTEVWDGVSTGIPLLQLDTANRLSLDTFFGTVGHSNREFLVRWAFGYIHSLGVYSMAYLRFRYYGWCAPPMVSS